jgi:omega-6 fatty acid desaturase (delta-12 desaturase)
MPVKTLDRQPIPDEALTVGKLRRLIPKRLFERHALTSLRFVAQDLAMVAMIVYLSAHFYLVPSAVMRALLWMAAWWLQGTIMMGIFVLAHECGHEAFSDYRWLNDSVGFTLHSMLLVPYYTWAYTHAQHHSNSNSVTRDAAFVPRTERNSWTSTIGRAVSLFGFVTSGLVVYFLCDATGPDRDDLPFACHWNPFCSIFRTWRERVGGLCSTLGVVAWLYCLRLIAAEYSWMSVICHFVMPWFCFNFWLVTITYLHHSDPSVPKYYPAEWTWLRGALGTIDRKYGFPYDQLMHHITDTHAVHHIFSKMPFYHAAEATKALLDSGVISEYYLRDDTPWYLALWQSWERCWVVGDDPITFYLSSEEFKAKKGKCE